MAAEWRCEACDTLLGEERGDALYVRLRRAQYLIGGEGVSVLAVCRSCAALSAWRHRPEAAPGAHTPGDASGAPQRGGER